MLADAHDNDGTSTKMSIVFPIPELGSCASKPECKLYCDNSSHIDACISWGQAHGLFTVGEAQKAREFLKIKGPGGCVGIACKLYCSLGAHIAECMEFARTHASDMQGDEGEMGSSSPEQLHGKLESILAHKPGPGGCTSVAACKTYCSDAGHAKECLTWAKQNGVMSGSDADHAIQLLTMTGPGGCKGLFACRAYCSFPDNLTVCRSYAMTATTTESGVFFATSSAAVQPELRIGEYLVKLKSVCTSLLQCRSYCLANNDTCKKLLGGASAPPLAAPPPGATVMPGTPAAQQQMCADYGGTWDGSHCMPPAGNFVAPNAPVQPSQTDMKAMCLKIGGTWANNFCTPPNKLPAPKPPTVTSPTSMTPMTAFVASVMTLFTKF
jgi:hypothetical protein